MLIPNPLRLFSIRSILFVLMSLSLTSCHQQIDFSKQCYKYKQDSTAVYASPDGPVVGYFKREHPYDCIQMTDSVAAQKWIGISYPGLPKGTFVHINDLEKMTVNERYQVGKALLFNKAWWANAGKFIELPTTDLTSFWVALAFSILLMLSYAFCRYVWVNWTLLLALDISELVYFMTYEGDRTWFFDMDKSIILAGISFVVIATTLCVQLRLIDTLLNYFYYGEYSKEETTLSSFLVLPIILIGTVLSWVVGEAMDYMPWAIIIEKIFWGIMAIVTICYAWGSKNILFAICSVITFILSYTAVGLVLTYSFAAIVYVIIMYNIIKNLPEFLTEHHPYNIDHSGDMDTIYVSGYGYLTGPAGQSGGTHFIGFNGDEAYYVNGNWYLRRYGELQHETEERIENTDPLHRF